MRAIHGAARAVAIGGALLLAAAGCAETYQVRTIVAPEAQLGALHTFRMLPTPRPRAERAAPNAYDPMVDNSIANRALRGRVSAAFAGRGYAADASAPDFVVAVYASAHEQLDVTAWDYGYPYWPRGGWGPRVQVRDRMTVYTEGTVVVDVVRAATRELLWRGSGAAALTKDPARDVGELAKVAEAVVQRFPRATPRAVVAHR